VEHLEEEGGHTADEHGRKIGVDLSGDGSGMEVGLLGIFAGDPSGSGDAEGPPDLVLDAVVDPPNCLHRDQFAGGASLFDGGEPGHVS
jgi:hypothetical protein